MNKESIRSILSVILVLSLLFVSSFEACALGKNANFDQKKELQELKANFNIEKKLKKVTGKKNVPKGLIKKVQNDIENLESVGWTLDLFDLDSVKSNDKIVYELDFGDVDCETNYVTVDENEDGSLILDFYEGDKHDVLEYTSDGKTLLDGKEIILKMEENNAYSDNMLMPNAGFTFVITDQCPYGKKSHYSYLGKTDLYPNYTLDKAIKNLVRGTLVSILLLVIGSATANPLSIKAGVGVALGTVADAMITYCDYNNLRENIISCKMKNYYHKSTKSYAINNTYKAKRVDILWYVGKNYKKYTNTTITYEYGVWG